MSALNSLPVTPMGFLSVSCNSQSKIYNLKFLAGVLAQLVERLNGIEEVTGSNPVGSTTFLLVMNSIRHVLRQRYDSFALASSLHSTGSDGLFDY